MSHPTLRINPAVDVAKCAEIYARDGMVQIKDILDHDTATRLTEILETSIPWSMTYYGPKGAPVTIPVQDIKGDRAQALRGEMDDLVKRSGEGYGFRYFNFGMITAYVNGHYPNHPIHPLTGFLNGEEFLEFGRKVTGEAAIVKTDAQATLYRPNDYIGLHVDHSDQGIERVAAYTLGFTSRWRSDWGGQLMFHDPETGDVTQGLVPRWNTLTLFKVPRLHSVATVAPYAKAARLSVIGWLRKDK